MTPTQVLKMMREAEARRDPQAYLTKPLYGSKEWCDRFNGGKPVDYTGLRPFPKASPTYTN